MKRSLVSLEWREHDLPDRDPQVMKSIEAAEREEVPERLLKLARELDDRLLDGKRRANPN